MFSENRSKIRRPAVSGQFYPDDPTELKALLNQMFQQARPSNPSHVKAVIAPHAGFIYSGPVAASAYQVLKSQAEQIKRVILLGPSHRVGFYGMATSSAAKFEMPQGYIPLDREAIHLIRSLPQVMENDQAHLFEHSLEVQLPFLQTVLNDFTLVPLVVGECPPDQVAEVLELLWGGDETLIVISSDLSHYNPYPIAQQQDQKTSEAIVNMQPQQIEYGDACGRNPVNGLLVSAKKHGLSSQMVDLRNSGDTAGSRDRVVGYGAYLFTD